MIEKALVYNRYGTLKITRISRSTNLNGKHVLISSNKIFSSFPNNYSIAQKHHHPLRFAHAQVVTSEEEELKEVPMEQKVKEEVVTVRQ